MAYDIKLAERIRTYLEHFPDLKIEEKKMFKGLSFLINGKMCVNVSGENMMCRFDPELTDTLSKKKGYEPMIMKNRVYKGYCYVTPVGLKAKKDFEYWVNLCLGFNDKAKSSKKGRSKK